MRPYSFIAVSKPFPFFLVDINMLDQFTVGCEFFYVGLRGDIFTSKYFNKVCRHYCPSLESRLVSTPLVGYLACKSFQLDFGGNLILPHY